MINKWLNAGVHRDGVLEYPDEGTPQGGVISPLLANVFLHEVLDVWFEREVKPRLAGSASLIRYADDAVMVFAREDDARRVLTVLAKRFARYGLTLHPEKTKIVDFRCPTRKGVHSEAFDALGFTHFWGLSLKGKRIVKRKTSTKAFTRALARVADWCRRNRHLRIREQYKALVQKVNGHYGYFGITGNRRALGCFYQEVRRVWRKWLDRRSYRAGMTWNRFVRLSRMYQLPLPHIPRSIYHA